MCVNINLNNNNMFNINTNIMNVINININWPAALSGSRLTALGHGFCICEWLARAQGPRHSCRHRRERLAHERHEAPRYGAATAELLQWCLGSAPRNRRVGIT